MQDFKWTSTKYTLSHYFPQSHDQTKLALYDSGIYDSTNHQAGVDFDLDLLFEDCFPSWGAGMLVMTFPFCSDVVINHLTNMQISFCFFLVHLILGLSASSLVTLQSQLMCRLCKSFPPQKPHILLCCSVSPMIILI